MHVELRVIPDVSTLSFTFITAKNPFHITGFGRTEKIVGGIVVCMLFGGYLTWFLTVWAIE